MFQLANNIKVGYLDLKTQKETNQQKKKKSKRTNGIKTKKSCWGCKYERKKINIS